MCLTEFDEEEAKRIWHEDGYTEGLSKGLAEGETKKAIEAAKNALSLKLSPEQAAQISGLSLEEVQKLVENLEVNA